MALDPVEQAAINRINSLFASVGAEAGNAASRLGDVARAASDASGGLGGFVSSLGSASSGVTGSTNKMTSSMNASAGSITTSAGILADASQNIIGKIASAVSGGTANFADAGGLATGMMGGVTKASGLLGKKFAGMAKPLAVVGKVAGVLGTALGAAANYNNDLLQNWRGLTRTGISLQGAMEEVGIAQGKANLSLHQLSSHLSSNSEAFAVLGGTASGGAEAFLQLQSTLQSVDLGYDKSSRSFRESLETLGITSDESASLITDMLGSQMLAAKFRNLDEKSQAESTADYIMNLDQLSKLTGKSREQLAQEQKQMANDTQFQAAMNGKSAEEMAAMQSAMQRIQEVGGPAAVEAFKARLAGVVPAGKEARMLLATPMGKVVEEMAGEMAGASGADQIGGIADSYTNALGEGAKQSRDMLLPLAKAGGLVAGEFSSLFGVMNKTVIRNQGLIDQQEKLTGTVVDLNIAMRAMLDSVSGTKREDPTDLDSEIVQVGSDLTNTVTEVTTSLQEIVNFVQVKSAELSRDYVPPALKAAMGAWNGAMALGEEVGEFFGQSWDMPRSAYNRDVRNVEGDAPPTRARRAQGPTNAEAPQLDNANQATLDAIDALTAQNAIRLSQGNPASDKGRLGQATRDAIAPATEQTNMPVDRLAEMQNAVGQQLMNTLNALSADELMNADQLQKIQQQFIEREVAAIENLGYTMTDSQTITSQKFDELVKIFQKAQYQQITGASDADVDAMLSTAPGEQIVDIAKVLGKTIEDNRAAEELVNRKLWVGTSNQDLATLIAQSQKISADRIIEAIEMAGKGSPTPRPSNNDIAGNEYAKQEGVR